MNRPKRTRIQWDISIDAEPDANDVVGMYVWCGPGGDVTVWLGPEARAALVKALQPKQNSTDPRDA